jgi:hypothetical protein
MSFTRKTVSINFNYKLYNNLILRSQCVADLGALLHCKLYFYHHTCLEQTRLCFENRGGYFKQLQDVSHKM